MTSENARKLCPTWAASEWRDIMEDKDTIRIWEPKKKEKQPKTPTKKPGRKEQENVLVMLVKDRRALAQVLVVFTLCNLLTWCSTMYAVRKNTTEEVTARVTSELRAGFQQYLSDMEAQQRKDEFLTGEDSFAAAVDDLANPMAQVIAAYAMEFGITEEGQKTIGWVFGARFLKNSSEFGRTPQEILEKERAWEGKVVGHAVRNQDLELAKEIATDLLNGKYPDNFTPELLFFTRDAGGKIIARNELYTGPYTTYWWFGK